MQDIQTENATVESCWKAIRKDLKNIVESKHGEVKTCGIRYWNRAIKLDDDTGLWSERGMMSKPSRWLFTCDKNGKPIEFTDRLAYFSLRNEALAFAVRAVPIFFDEKSKTYEFVDHTEWIIVFIAKSLTPRGSSSATAHSCRLNEGVITITTDDREFEVPLECIGLIKPEDQLNSHVKNEIHRSLENHLSLSASCYDLNEDVTREAFLKRVDKLQATPESEALSLEGAWMSEDDLKDAHSLFESDASNLMLWGHDHSSLRVTLEHLENASVSEFVHFESLPNWNESTLANLLDSNDLSDKVVCIHASERFNPELVLPSVFPRPKSTSIVAPSGKTLLEPKAKPRAWIFIASRLELGQIRQWHRTFGDELKWFRCETAISSLDAVKKIYQEENIQASATNWFDNLFVIMWDELIAHLPVSTEALAAVVRSCLSQDHTAVWDLDATPIQKGILIREIEVRISSLIASLPTENRKQCVNSLVRTLDVPQSQSQSLLSLAKVL